MNKALVIIAIVALAVAAMFYVLLKNSSAPTHIHFMAPAGFVRGVIYYSETPPAPPDHSCDGQYTEMRDDLYEVQLNRWEEKYGRK